jgi:hypothetical protein
MEVTSRRLTQKWTPSPLPILGVLEGHAMSEVPSQIVGCPASLQTWHLKHKCLLGVIAVKPESSAHKVPKQPWHRIRTGPRRDWGLEASEGGSACTGHKGLALCSLEKSSSPVSNRRSHKKKVWYTSCMSQTRNERTKIILSRLFGSFLSRGPKGKGSHRFLF